MTLYQKRKYIRIISFFVLLSLLLGVLSAVNGVKAHNYKLLATASNEKALNELCENLENITTALQKGMYCTKGVALKGIEGELSKSAACAKLSLSQLGDETVITDEVYKFLSQVSAFTSCLNEKVENSKELSEKEKEGARALYAYSENLSKAMTDILQSYNESGVVFEKKESTLKEQGTSESALFTDSLNDARDTVGDYPTLIYDGPFADSLLQREPQIIKGKDEITAAEAKKLCAKYLSVNESDLRQDSDEESKLSLYCFSAKDKSIGITKKGGFVCYITSPGSSAAENISCKEAVKRGKKELSQMGYNSLTESYYTTYDGICTINFAYTNEGVIHYADLIKISISLDTGEVTSLDARGYLTNHRERTLPKIRISEEEARESVSELLSVISTKTALIPTDSSVEKLCYEFHCNDEKGKEYLVYIDVEKAQQQDILILLYEDGGTLVK